MEGQWEVAISEKSHPSMYQNITEGKFDFFDEILSKSTSTYNLDPGLYTSISDIVEAMNTLIKGRNNHNKTCITVKVSRRTQKVVIMLANGTSGLAFCRTYSNHIFWNNVAIEFGVLMIGKVLMYPNLPTFSHSFADNLQRFGRLQNCWRHKNSLLRCFPLISKLKGGNLITTGQYINYQTFSNLQFRPLLKNSFHSIHNDLRDTSGEKIPFVSVGITRLVLMFRKVSNSHF